MVTYGPSTLSGFLRHLQLSMSYHDTGLMSCATLLHTYTYHLICMTITHWITCSKCVHWKHVTNIHHGQIHHGQINNWNWCTHWWQEVPKGVVRILGGICPRSDPAIAHMEYQLDPLKDRCYNMSVFRRPLGRNFFFRRPSEWILFFFVMPPQMINGRPLIYIYSAFSVP